MLQSEGGLHSEEQGGVMVREEAKVRTSYGVVQGAVDHGVYNWRGIPYAQRLDEGTSFLPPEAITRWSGVLMAKEFSGICPQRSVLRKNVSWNCLTLNIWSPAPDAKRRPVLFFIHGGSFKHGAGSESYYNGAHLARTWDIVVVTCNYRLGVYGFLDFSELDPQFSSNNGVRDIVAALRWIHHAIADFGGDPELVTLVGQSAGATMVSALVTMDSIRSYFHRAVMMSGGPTQLQSTDTCKATTRSFLEYSEITTARELTSLSWDQLISRQKAFIRSYGMGAATFRITVDRDLVPAMPIDAAQRGLVSVPLLIGTTKEEMGFLAIKPLARLLDVHTIVKHGLAREEDAVLEQLEEAYHAAYGERGRSMFYTDLLFRISSLWFAQALAQHKGAWMYRFDFETAVLRMNGLHAIHSSDLPFVFGNFKPVLVRPLFLLDHDKHVIYSVAEHVQRDLVNFMRTGVLDWPQSTARTTDGKCYNELSTIDEMIDQTVNQIYGHTVYKKTSLAGVPI